jgi:hypothetical protein
LFEKFFLSSHATTIVAILSHYGTLRGMAIANGKSPSGPIGGIILTILIALPLWFFIARKGSGIARWIAIAFFVIGLLGVPGSLLKTMSVGPVYFGLSIISLGLSVASFAMLFRADAVSWIKNGGKSPTIDPEVFS